MSIGVVRKTGLLLWTLLLLAMASALLVLAGSPADAQAAGLTITKTDNPDPVFVGQDLTYTITVRNTGTNRANNVRITDQLPANVVFVGASPGCTNSNGTVTCNPFNLNAGSTATRTITVRPTQPGAINNTATARADNRAAVSVTEQTTVRSSLSITKTDSPDPVLVGGRLTYTITVTNVSNSTATNVGVADLLPNGTTFVSANSSQGTCSRSGNTVACNIGSLAVGASATVTIAVDAPGTPGTITNNAGALVNNREIVTTTEQTTVVERADLSIAKSDDADPVLLNGNFSYALAVSNATGAGTATEVRITDELPADVGLNGPLLQGCTSSTGQDGRVSVACDLGTVDAGQTVSRTINVTAGGSPRTVSNTATVTSPRDPTDASDTEQTTVAPAANLSLTKSDNPDPVTFGNDLTYGISVTNNGTANATNVQVTDQLPDDVTFVSASAGCDYDAPSRTVTCDLGTINIGAPAVTRQIVVTPTAAAVGTTLTNRATVSSPNDPTDSTATATTQVIAADLRISKTDSEDPIFAGENFDYILRISNEGAGDAQDVVVTDRLPDGLEFVEAPDCSYNPANRVVTCQLGTINAGDPAVERRITVTAPADPMMLRNTATVRSPNDPTNGRDGEQTTTVAASADLAIDKQAPAEVTDEDTFTYTLTVTNNGPSTAEDVSITDELPAGIRFDSASAGCDYDPDARTVTCNVGNLASGATVERQIIVQARTPGDKVNSATVSSQTDDPNDQNNTATATTTVNAAADLAIDKQAPAEVTDEQEFDYTLTVTNDGPSGATDVMVTDVLPGGVEFVEMGTDGRCQYNPANRVVRCELGDLGTTASDNSTEVVIRVKAKQPGNQLNRARVSSDIPDPDESNNRSREVTTVIQALADLAIDKSGSPAAVNAGEVVTYTLSVTNNGPSDATGVVVTDELPANVEFVSAGTDARCQFDANDPNDPGDDTVTCARAAPLAAPPDENDDTFTIKIRPTLAAAGSTLTNEATVTSDTPDPDTANNTATAITQVLAADLTITKTDSEDPVLAGENFTYILEVANAGAGDATNVQVTDTLPAEVQFVSAPGCDYDAPSHTVTCDLGTINAGQTVTRNINVRAPPQPGTISNTATVKSPNDPTDSGDTEQTTVVAAADLVIDKQAPAEATDGQAFDYTLTVANNGPNAAQNVIVEDELPDGVTYNDGASTASCELIANTPDPNDVRCTLADPLPANGQATFTINVTATQPGEQVNQATVRSDTADPNDLNNSDEVSTTVLASSDLSIAKSAPATATDGQRFSYVLDVANGGPSDASGVVVTDELPIGVEFVRADTDERCEYDADTRTVSCDLGILANGGTTQVQIGVRATQPGPAENTASVDGNEPDPDVTNNADTATTQVNAALNWADLEIDKQAPATVNDEDNFTYTLTVTNNGPDAAQNVIVEDELPDGVEFVSASQGCDPPGVQGVVTCNLGNLASGATVEVTIVVKAKQPGPQRNVATVSSDTPDPNDANNRSVEVTTVIQALADLAIDKEAPAEVADGDRFVYSLRVANDGPSDAVGVKVKDRLPRGLKFVSASDGCEHLNGTVRCGPFGLESGRAVEKRIVVRAETPGEKNNTATVASSTDDPDGQNNTASATTRVDAVANLSIEKSAPATIVDEQEFDYTLAIENSGPSNATSVSVTDRLPEGVRFVSAPDDCRNDGGTVICDLGKVTSGDEVRIVIRVKAKTPGKKVNRATVSSDTENRERSNMRNNSDTATTMVRPKPAPSADLSLRKSAPGTVTEGKNFAYTLTVRNNGPDAAMGVVIKDRLPGGVRFVSASGSCENQGGTVTCSAGKLNDGATLTKKIVVRADEDGRLRNSATVRSEVGDPILRNNSDTETTRARPEREGPCTEDQTNTSNTNAQDGCGREPQAGTSNQEARKGR